MTHFLRYLKIAFSSGYVPTISAEREHARLQAELDQARAETLDAQERFFMELAKR